MELDSKAVVETDVRDKAQVVRLVDAADPLHTAAIIKSWKARVPDPAEGSVTGALYPVFREDRFRGWVHPL